jgi:hypothetical protein
VEAVEFADRLTSTLGGVASLSVMRFNSGDVVSARGPVRTRKIESSLFELRMRQHKIKINNLSTRSFERRNIRNMVLLGLPCAKCNGATNPDSFLMMYSKSGPLQRKEYISGIERVKA